MEKDSHANNQNSYCEKVYITKIFNALPIIIPEIVSTDESLKFGGNFKNLSKNGAGETTVVPYLMLCSHSNGTTMIQHKSRGRNRRWRR